MNCKVCNKETTVICHSCKQGICSEHGYHIRKYFYCADCFFEERKKGLLKSWGMVFILLIIGIITVLLMKSN